jgi:predicted PurR-regulated permease PerM
MISSKGARIAFLIFFGVLVAAFLYMASPLMKAAFMAMIVAVIFHPVYKFFLKLFKQHNYIAAVVTTVLSFGVVLVPLFVILTILASNIAEFAARLAGQLQSQQMAPVIDQLNSTINGWLSSLPGGGASTFDLRVAIVDLVKAAGKFLYQFSPRVLATTAKIGVNLVVFVLFLVVLFAEGSKLFAWLVRALPLSVTHQEEISRQIRVMISATLLGMISVAVIQGLLIGLGFWAAGFSEPVMWGFIAVPAAFIPIVGAASCYIGAVIVLLALGRWQAAIIFLIYGFVFVSSVDNIVRPLVMGGQARVHPLLLFIALLGGVRAFGPIGIVFGPVLLAVFLSSLRIYQREFTTQ